MVTLKTTTEQSQQYLHSACVVSFIQDSKSVNVFEPTLSNVLQGAVQWLLQVSLRAIGSHKSESQEHQLLATKLHSTLWRKNLFSTFPLHDELDRRVSWRRDESLMETFVVRRMLLFVVLETFMKKKKPQDVSNGKTKSLPMRLFYYCGVAALENVGTCRT